MEHTALLVAVDFIEDADVEHPIVDDQEEYRPFDKWEVEALDALLHKGGFIVEILCGEEIACCDEEERHVEFENESAQPAGCLGVGDDHQDDGNALTNGYDSISFHFTAKESVNCQTIHGTSARAYGNDSTPLLSAGHSFFCRGRTSRPVPSWSRD